jgi:hypothetical protein
MRSRECVREDRGVRRTIRSCVMHHESPPIPSPKLPILLQCAFPTRLRLSIASLPLLSFVHSQGSHARRPVPWLLALASNSTLDAWRSHGQRDSTRPRTSGNAPISWRRCLRSTVSWEPQSVPPTGIRQRHELVFHMRLVVLIHRRPYPTHDALIFLCDAFGLRPD